MQDKVKLSVNIEDVKCDCLKLIYDLFKDYPGLRAALHRKVADTYCLFCLEALEEELIKLRANLHGNSKK